MRLVERQENRQMRLDAIRVDRPAEVMIGRAQHCSRAMAGMGAHQIERHRRQAVLRQTMIEARREIRRGVDEGPVEIEDGE